MKNQWLEKTEEKLRSLTIQELEDSRRMLSRYNWYGQFDMDIMKIKEELRRRETT